LYEGVKIELQKKQIQLEEEKMEDKKDE